MLRLIAAGSLWVVVSFAPAVGGAIQIDTVLVGDPGNPDDTVDGNPSVDGTQTYGGVENAFRIGRYEVTNAQYVEFLNFKAKDDPHSLYIPFMASDPHGGILRTGEAGSYAYTARAGMANHPVAFVNWYDAARFVNWLHNGGGDGDTETGAYTMSLGAAATRNSGAEWFLPTKDEWYKAAFYQPAAAGGDADGYWRYPTQTNADPYSDQPPGSSSPDPSNAANYFYDDGMANGYNDGYAPTGEDVVDPELSYLTDVGAYSLAESYYGTFDQGGNAYEWNETSYASGANRGLWGGGYSNGAAYMRSTFGYYRDATNKGPDGGFRVASSVAAIPEPGSLALALVGAMMCLVIVKNRARRANLSGPGA